MSAGRPHFCFAGILLRNWRSVKLDRLVIDQIENDELIVANLHDGGNGFVWIFGKLCFGVVHLKKRSRDAVRAIGGSVFNIYQHYIDIDHSTQLNLHSNADLNARSHLLRPRIPTFRTQIRRRRATPRRIVNMKISRFRRLEQSRAVRNSRHVRRCCNSASKCRLYLGSRGRT